MDSEQIDGGAKKSAATGKPPPWIDVIMPIQDELDAAGAKYVDEVFAKLTKGKKPIPLPRPGKDDPLPHLVLTIGSPGAGKSTIARLLVESKSSQAGSYVEFDCDSVLDYLPAGDQIRRARDMRGRPTAVGFAYGWDLAVSHAEPVIVGLIAKLLEGRYNLILHSHDQRDLVAAQAHGYGCTLLYVAVSLETALRRAASRAHALGRYIGPGATEENSWGWQRAVETMWKRYRNLAAWYALWADNLVVVNNDRDGKYPRAADFEVLVCHPPLTQEQPWRLVVTALEERIAAAHGEKK